MLRIGTLCFLFVTLPGLVLAQDGPTPLVSIRGVLRSIGKKEIVIDTGDDQVLTFKRTKKTRFLKGAGEIKPGDFPNAARVFIEASRAMNGDLDAVNVFLGEPPAKAKGKQGEGAP